MVEYKIWPAPFAAVADGSKTFELRLDDEKAAAVTPGSKILLREWCNESETYTGRQVIAQVGYIARLEGQPPTCYWPWPETGSCGLVIFSLTRIFRNRETTRPR